MTSIVHVSRALAVDSNGTLSSIPSTRQLQGEGSQIGTGTRLVPTIRLDGRSSCASRSKATWFIPRNCGNGEEVTCIASWAYSSCGSSTCLRRRGMQLKPGRSIEWSSGKMMMGRSSRIGGQGGDGEHQPRIWGGNERSGDGHVRRCSDGFAQMTVRSGQEDDDWQVNRGGDTATTTTTTTKRENEMMTQRRVRRIPVETRSSSSSSSLSARWQKEMQSADEGFNTEGGELPPSVAKETHKYFDQVTIVVRSGDGGHGAVLRDAKPSSSPTKRKKKAAKKGRPKRSVDGSLILPVGGEGSDVYVYADEALDSLLDLHKRKKYSGKRGGNVDGTVGFTSRASDGSPSSPLRIPVPVGTVVKRKRGGKLMADLCKPGDQVLVARGGRGGISLLDVPKAMRAKLEPTGVNLLQDPLDKDLTIGLPGEEVTLELTLRVVADVGLVGLPNAGKSSLLAAVTAAKPAIADYPFTTLIPNLGKLDGDPDSKDGGFQKGPTMADLPGLIAGAHTGRGLGRMFLRHLRRTRLLVHIVDAAANDPFEDYQMLREELWMYNPDYVKRPHLVVLNKLDLPQASMRFEMLHKQFTLGAAGSPSRAAEYLEALSVKTESRLFDTRQESSPRHPEADALSALEEVVTRTERAEEEEEEKGEGDTVPKWRHAERQGMANEANEGGGDVGGVESQRRSAMVKNAMKEEEKKILYQFHRPIAVVGISARSGVGIEELLKQIRAALDQDNNDGGGSSKRGNFDKAERVHVQQSRRSGSWQL